VAKQILVVSVIGRDVEEMETHVTHAPITGTPLFSMRSRVQVPPDLSLRQLRNKLTDVGEEIDVDTEISLPKS
jgi:glycine cleavage system regulatory protein